MSQTTEEKFKSVSIRRYHTDVGTFTCDGCGQEKKFIFTITHLGKTIAGVCNRCINAALDDVLVVQ